MAHILIAAPHKSSGKTTITLGLCAALAHRNYRVQAFKKGPDYIDPMWLARASGRPCYNLDFHTQSDAEIRATFARASSDTDLALIEGNMGMFDSVDPDGASSNAALAVLLGAPVVLVVNTQGMNRSIAPLILGFQHFDPTVRVAGVILNNVAGRRHETKLRSAVERYTDLPVLGLIHRNPELTIDERHLGLVPSNEADQADWAIDRIVGILGDQLDLDGILAVGASAEPVTAPAPELASIAKGRVRIGIARDAAFGFYYPDDLEKLEATGAELVPFDALHDQELPAVDGLFIGGGFPETQMDALAANGSLRNAIREAIDAGLPVYAECGGLMYLTRSIRWGDRMAEMVGVIPADTVMHKRPVGRGYVRLRATGAHPWRLDADGKSGLEFNAHEFHYSSLENLSEVTFAYDIVRGSGVDGRHDGIAYRNLLANYTHLRSVEGYHWAVDFVEFVRRVRAGSGRLPFTNRRSSL